jgi:hypothetical protein
MRHCLLFVLAALVLVACASPPLPSPLDEQFGMAVQEAVRRQSVMPEALDPQDAPLGMDGQAVRAGIDRYQKSFDTLPAKASVFSTGSSTAP